MRWMDYSKVELGERFVHEPPWREQFPKNWGMRAVGRIGVGLHCALGDRADRPLGILTYHRVADRPSSLPAPLHNVTPRRFYEQLLGLKRRGFQFWALDRVLACHHSGTPVPRGVVVVTFDDGFATVCQQSLPILKDLQIPATVFLNTAYVDTQQPFPFDAWGVAHRDEAPADTWRPLSWMECEELVASGLVSVGAHTHTHEDFRGRPDEFECDVRQSAGILRQRFQMDDVTFAFPYGSPFLGFAGGELAQSARSAGVSCALTTECGLVDPQSDPYHWGRFNVFAWDTAATLAAKLSDWYGWAPRMKKRITAVLRGQAAGSR